MATITIQSNTTASASTGGLPLVERLDSAPDASEVFRRLAHLPHVVFFDSAMRHPQLGRYSFVAAEPVEWIELPADTGDAFDSLQRRMSHLRGSGRADLPPFQGGWAGLFGYELARSLESIPAPAVDEFQVPALAVGLYDVVVTFDHVRGAAWIVSQGWPETDAVARRERAAARLARFKSLLSSQGDLPRQGKFNSPSTSASPCLIQSAQHAVAHMPALTSNFTGDGFRHAVQQAIDYIRAGDVFQVNLAQRLLHSASGSPVELYLRLRECNPAPFAAYFDAGRWQICSASPERFLNVRNGHVETRPIKGTRRRGASAADDRAAADALLASRKDRAENVMIVDLLRNDLSRTCRPDSVRVSQLCGLETYASVHHLASVVEGDLRHDRSPLDLLRTSFPGGSVTGAPKVRAMEIIAELEPTARGAYCGALGYLGLDGQMDTNILIRTITAAGGWWQLPVGGGIVAGSKPDDELAETWHKAEAMLRAMQVDR